MDNIKLQTNILKGAEGYQRVFYQHDKENCLVYLSPNGHFAVVMEENEFLLNPTKFPGYDEKGRFEGFKKVDVKKVMDNAYDNNKDELKLDNIILGDKKGPKKIQTLIGPDYEVWVNADILALLTNDKRHEYKFYGNGNLAPICIIEDGKRKAGVVSLVRKP